jgi:hypothetical protein
MLQVLHEQDRGVLSESQLHGGVNLELQESAQVPATLSEFEGALRIADGQRLVIGVPGRWGGKVWSISDAGEVARAEN